MTYLDILNKWASYSEYDSEQHKFNLLSVNYEFHKIGKLIETILKDYDATGMLGVVYAKNQFLKILKNSKISLFDAICNPGLYKDEQEMIDIFQSDIVKDAEHDIYEKIHQIYLNIMKNKLIGENNNQEVILDSLLKVLESFNNCKVELFKSGGEITISNYSSSIHIFETLAECLLAVERAKDGVYLCFIRAGQSADCFFGFFIKSNGAILSINDRIPESYIGQHGNSRNGRWSEEKADNIFPYDYIFNFSEYDYKGYANKYMIDEEKLSLANMEEEASIPIIMALLLLTLKYSGKKIELPIHYVDSFLPINQEKIEEHALMECKGSELARLGNQVNLEFENDKILDGSYNHEYGWEGIHLIGDNKESESISQLFVNLYGKDFIPDFSKTFKGNVDCLIDKENDIYIPEFVGTEYILRRQAYKDIRQQLADYISENMYQEWINFGKTEAVKKWYYEKLIQNKENLYQLMINFEKDVLSGKERNFDENWSIPGKLTISMVEDDYPSGYGLYTSSFIDCHKDRLRGPWISDLNGKKCNLWFVFRLQNWKMIEELIDCEVPKIMKGWIKNRCGGDNFLLSATDAVDFIKTPFEIYNGKDEKYKNSYFDFSFAFGFSKSGWNQLKREFKKGK